MDINALVSEHIDLAYHGKRAQVQGLQVEIERSLGERVGQLEMVPQEIGRVLLNLLGNASPTGSGTGLGLSLSYDIDTQGHGGTLREH